ncbi:hypothetical protein SAMN04488490_1842 [Marinobacter sp. LV10R510-11A]|uniref:hypothetical protein n=1 Tax=Marinobacter sp. LV10R510-11A TaxID=1415568 RepID=UPI000BB9382F|nr:hypothetical protein [Marinobacter sp. LV10R510-11A]SOB76165.1 hypothetical protein SAMN04488490_1842 [Marinobacter sp. LV10R510-11A]
MRKRSGPSLRKEKRPLKRCPECNGRGVVKPMFYELDCDHCHRSGLVDKETGEGMPMDVLVQQLCLLLNEREQELAELRAKLMNLTGREKANSRGAGGSHYRGD